MLHIMHWSHYILHWTIESEPKRKATVSLAPVLIPSDAGGLCHMNEIRSWRKLSRMFQTSLLPATLLSSSCGPLRRCPDGICSPSSKLWVYPWVSSQLSMPSKAPKRHPEITCPIHFNWLPSTWRSSEAPLGCTNHWLRRRKLILAVCTNNLFLLITTEHKHTDLKVSCICLNDWFFL